MSEQLDSKMGELVSRLRESVAAFRAFSPSEPPTISIITPTWNTKPHWLLELAISILEQSYLYWEWLIVDDCSSDREFHRLFPELLRLPNIKIRKLNDGEGISGATNRGLEMASGEFVCFVDHDDLLARHALRECMDALGKGFDAVYTDSDKIDEAGRHSEPFHKPDWSPEFFRGVMFVGHLLCVRRTLAEAVGGFDIAYNGVQDFEFFLRFSEQTERICHVPEILYHWRTVVGSVASQSDAKGDLGRLQRRAVQAQLDRLGLQATAEPGDFAHRLKIGPKPRFAWPTVSIIIPTKDSPDILRQCLYSLFSKTTYPAFEVLCIDNGTSDPDALEEMKQAPVQRIILPGKFNFSRANNLGLEHAAGQYLVFMNNDIETLTPDWIEQFLYYVEQPDVGAVGGLLLYPNETVQHAGVVLGVRGTADHVSRNWPPDVDGYAGSMSCAREISAVTAACMMIPKSVYGRVGGFNEHFFTAYQDVDLCLKVRQQGLRIIWTPRVRFIHHESLSRGGYYDHVDRHLLLDYWEHTIKAGDPYFNKHFNLEACNYSLS